MTSSSSTSPAGSPAPTARSSSPTAAPRSSRSSRPRAIRCARWSASGAAIPAGDDGALFTFLSSSKQSVVADPDDADDLERVCTRCWSGPTRSSGRGDPASPSARRSRRTAIRRAAPAPDRHGDHAVRAGRPVVRPRRDRVHAAGVVRAGSSGLGRGVAGPGPGVRRRPDRRVAHRHLRGDRDAGLAGARPGTTARASSSTSRCSRRSRCASPTTRSPTTTWSAGRSGAGGPSSRPGVETTSDGLVGARRRDRPAVARLLRDGRAPRVDGGPLALRQPRAPARRTSPRGWPSTPPPRSSSSPARSASRTRRSATAPRSRRPTTSQARGSIVRNGRGRRRRARPPVPLRPAVAPSSRAGAEARRARRRTTAAAATPDGRRRDAAVRGSARPRPDRVLGRPAVHARAGDAGRRGPPPRVDGAARRHPPARRPAVLGARLVGAVGDLRRPQHQQEERDARPRPATRDGSCCAG